MNLLSKTIDLPSNNYRFTIQNQGFTWSSEPKAWTYKAKQVIHQKTMNLVKKTLFIFRTKNY